MTDPIGTAQELIERDLDALRYVLNFADSNSRVSTIMRTFQLPDRVTTEERLERLYATVQSRIAEVERLEAALMDALDFIRGDISGSTQREGILRQGAEALAALSL